MKDQIKKQETIRTTKMGRHYVMRRIIKIEETSLGYKVYLECGHYEWKHPHPSLSVNAFLLSQPETKDKARFGCFECGETLWNLKKLRIKYYTKRQNLNYNLKRWKRMLLK